jgi:hypothetical protein
VNIHELKQFLTETNTMLFEEIAAGIKRAVSLSPIPHPDGALTG